MVTSVPFTRPRKRFGQNFLRSPQVIERILAAAELTADDRVMEIGPGLGVLTDRMLLCGVDILAVEIDRDLAAILSKRDERRLTVWQGDVLRADWSQLLSDPPYKLVANLPYNISSQVMFKVLDHRQLFSRLVLMFQKEVGERLLALPATRNYGILSVLVQNWFEISRVTRVAPGSFFPQPKVDSVVLRFDSRSEPLAPVDDESAFRCVVKAVFTQRRKTLRNGLLGAGYDANSVDTALTGMAIDPRSRGETLSIGQLACLADALKQSQFAG